MAVLVVDSEDARMASKTEETEEVVVVMEREMVIVMVLGAKETVGMAVAGATREEVLEVDRCVT